MTNGPDPLRGTLLLPPGRANHRIPAALLLSGSSLPGQNGAVHAIPDALDVLQGFAHVLARQGVASLRFDSHGSGHAERSQQSCYAKQARAGLDLCVDEARAAYQYLKVRPELDPRRLMILGHGEGGLVALVLAVQLMGRTAPRALVLAAPCGAPILKTVRNHVVSHYARAQQTGQMSKQEAATAVAELDRIITNLKETGMIPMHIAAPGLKGFFNPGVTKVLAREGRYDPAALAVRLPPTLPILLLHGQKDQYSSMADVQYVRDGLCKSGHATALVYDLPGVDHVFAEVPDLPYTTVTDVNHTTVTDVNRSPRFSQEAALKLATFIKAHLHL